MSLIWSMFWSCYVESLRWCRIHSSLMCELGSTVPGLVAELDSAALLEQ